MLIGELSALTGVSARSLRYYEQEGLLTSARDGNGYRAFAEGDVETVLRIRSLLNVGLPLRTVRQMLPCVIDASPRLDPCSELRQTLHTELERLDAAAAEISRCRDLITGILDRSAPA
ncbi:MerR family transcriptional regulator [Lentzea sp. NBRC 105346]|uniref:MerR family transcriptional regulator n=1 Tax=Lentzea sp. NBRC 105346 TaxID=3032205 RepID=UPI0024A17DFE|nr:MerR family transcriptional regulator [Lentzea sp. NBRC 105346]GLZ29986.1 MerR family transcriptional regulator [Lentzea sp. NBRC 105346]